MLYGNVSIACRSGLRLTCYITTVVLLTASPLFGDLKLFGSKKGKATTPQATSPQPSEAESSDPLHGPPKLRGPVHAYSWYRVARSCVNITPMIWVNRRTDPRYAAYLSRTRPEGRAIFMLDNLAEDILRHPEDVVRTPDGALTEYRSPWPVHGIDESRRKVNEFFRAFAQHGGRIDRFALDNEDYLAMWILTKEHAQAIQDDPRSAGLKQRLGFDDFTPIFRFRSRTEYLTWNATLHAMVVEAINEAVYDPLRQLFPGVQGSNYRAFIVTPEEVAPDKNWHYQYRTAYVGTHGSLPFYGRFGVLATRKLDGENRYGDSPFAVFRWHLNTIRGILRSSNVPFIPWVSHKGFGRSFLRDSPYYEELIYHLVLSGVDDIQYWNPHFQKDANVPGGVYSDDGQDMLLDNCLAEVNARLGTQERWCKTLSPIEWDSPFVATGMQISKDRVLWRVTAPPEVTQLRFHRSGETIDLSSQAGFWYTTNAKEELRFDVTRSNAP